jgi:hypothetical protein
MMAIIKAQRTDDLRELYIAAMFAMYLRAPARPTREEVRRGAITDLGEIGSVPEAQTWSRETPYSPAQRVMDQWQSRKTQRSARRSSKPATATSFAFSMNAMRRRTFAISREPE